MQWIVMKQNDYNSCELNSIFFLLLIDITIKINNYF